MRTVRDALGVLPHLAVAAALAALSGCGSKSPSGPGGGSPPEVGALLQEDLASRQVFPTNNWWNLDIGAAPVDPGSDGYIAFIGAGQPLHPDFGPPPFGIPYVTVSGTQPRLPFTFSPYGNESDPGAAGQTPGYPVPDAARTQPNYIEGGLAGGGSSGDRHLLVIDRDHWLLFETYATHWNGSLSRWEAASGAVFDLASNARRPDTWTSADAAGCAIFPGLVRYDDAAGSQAIRHALRVTVSDTHGYVWPASHSAGSAAGAPPMGARLRLKATVDLSGYAPAIQRIFQSMKTYGLIVADNGSSMYITGTMDARWDNDQLNPAFASLHTGDFDVVALGWGHP
jgi:hypothetical protein